MEKWSKSKKDQTEQKLIGIIGNRPWGIQWAWLFWCHTQVWHWNVQMKNSTAH